MNPASERGPSPPYPLLSHVDLRVRSHARACAFYDALLLPLGARRRDADDGWTNYDDAGGYNAFGFIEDTECRPNDVRIAFSVPDRATADAIARRLPELGARNIEPPGDEYGPEYYAYFFEDPDGNRLEIKARERG